MRDWRNTLLLAVVLENGGEPRLPCDCEGLEGGSDGGGEASELIKTTGVLLGCSCSGAGDEGEGETEARDDLDPVPDPPDFVSVEPLIEEVVELLSKSAPPPGPAPGFSVSDFSGLEDWDLLFGF